MAEVNKTKVLTVDRIFQDYALAARRVKHLKAYEQDNENLVRHIIDRTKVFTFRPRDMAESREAYSDPTVGDWRARHFGNLAIMETIKDDLAEAEHQLSRLAVGRTVKISPMAGQPDLIKQTAISTQPTEHQVIESQAPELPVRGTIAEIDLIGNSLWLSPMKYSHTAAAEGFYKVPVVDEDSGRPLVDIRFRNPNFRDKPHSRLLRILGIIVKPSLPGKTSPLSK